METDLSKLPNEPRIEKQVRGTRILAGNTALRRRYIESLFANAMINRGYSEVILPALEKAEIYTDKAGTEILSQMYVFKDKKDRDLCLRPEGTATCQLLAKEVFKQEKDVKLFYVTSCWRYERPQEGRYREFRQFGVEVLNPTKDYTEELVELAVELVALCTDNYTVSRSVKRGLQYYVSEGFEVLCPQLGAQKQVCGGGPYKEGIGFALGLDRLQLAMDLKDKEKL